MRGSSCGKKTFGMDSRTSERRFCVLIVVPIQEGSFSKFEMGQGSGNARLGPDREDPCIPKNMM
jgi:hypothetical protein